MKKLLLLILVTLGYANYTAAIAGKYNPPPATFATTITGPVAAGATYNSSPIPVTITLGRTAVTPLTTSSFTLVNASSLTNFTEKVVLTYASQFGTAGTGNTQFNKPNDITVDAAGNTYVTDGVNNRVEVFNSTGGYVTQFGSAGTGDGQFSNPYGIAVDAAGNIYVADGTINGRIQEFNSAGTFIKNIGAGLLNTPQGLFIDASGNLYVADSGNNRVAVFNSAGTYSRAIGAAGSDAGQFYGPSGVVVDANSFVYVTDPGNNRIVKFNAAGVGVSAIGSFGTGNGMLRSPAGITTDGTKKLYVVDNGNQRIEIFSTNGTFLGTAGAAGTTGNGNLNFPTGITADKNGNIYVADRTNNRIQRFTAKEQYTASLIPAANGTVTISLDAAKTTDINGDDNDAATYSVNYVATPSKPTGLIGTPLVGNIELDWTANDAGDNVFSYTIYEGTSANSLTPKASIPSNTTSYTSPIPLTNGTTYYYYITAVTAAGVESIPSDIVSITPKSNQTITAGTIPDQVYNAPAFRIDNLATASSGLGVTYSISSGPATYDAASNSITVTGVGSVTVAVDQAGNNFYFPAPTVYVTFNVGKATPVINWSPATTLTYGTALGSTTFTATATKSGTTTPALSGTIAYTYGGATINSSTVLPAGDDDLVATYTPSSPDDANYTGATKTVTVHVGKATPVIDWIADNSSIPAKSTVPAATVEGGVQGTFTYSPSGTLHYTGASQTLTVTFTPSSPDDANYGPASKTVHVTVTQLTPALSWTPPVTTFTYGTPLAATEFNASIVTPSLTGPFTYVEHTGDILSKGTHTLTAHFAPDDADYAAADVTAQVTVTAATPQIVWATPADISYGTALSNVQLNATTVGNVGGTMDYSPASGAILPAGTAEPLTATFTATDPNYDATPVTATVYINVGKATPVINWSPATTLTYGTPLGSGTFTATATKSGTTSPALSGTIAYTYGGATINGSTVLPAGDDDLVATYTPSSPDDANYTGATKTVTVHVGKATPVIDWIADNSSIPAKSTVPAATVEGGVQGTFTYSPSGTLHYTGASQTLTVTFTPSSPDDANYGPASKTVHVTVTQLTPALSWTPPVTTFTYGTPLAATEFNASIITPSLTGPFTYVEHTGDILSKGTHTLTAHFAPDDADYAAADVTAQVTVTAATPQIVWATPADISYGTALSNVQLNATTVGNVGGTTSYSPAAGTVLPAGTAEPLTVTFTATDPNYDATPVTATVYINVGKATPVINWSPATTLTYGTALGSGTFTATATKSGTTTPALSGSIAYTYGGATIDASTVLPAGDDDLVATYTPSSPDDANYTGATKTVTVHVGKATPVIDWIADNSSIPAKSTIPTATVEGGVQGTFTYSPSGTLHYTGSSQTLTVTFTPSSPDDANYGIASKTVHVTITQLTPALSWTPPVTTFTYGTPLSATEFNATIVTPSLTGPFTYVEHTGDILSKGTHTLTAHFAPDDADYAAADVTAQVTVTAATPQIVWSTPADISYGTALSNVQLNATTVGNVGGTTSYSPASGAILPAGTAEPLTVTFTATDPNYDATPVTATVYINVGKATPVINWNPATTLTYGTPLGSGTFTATATKSGTTTPALSGSIAYTYGGATIDASTVLPAGDDQLTATYTPSSPDDANYTGATKTVTVHVGKATPVIDWIADNSSIPAKSTVPTATVEGGVQGTFTYSPSGTLHYTGASQTLTVTFTPSSPDDANYGIASKTVHVTVTQLTPALSWTPPVTTFSYGTPLAATEFNASIVTPSLTGPFTYVEHTGDILSKGTHTLTAHFAPDDADYAAADVTAQVTVTAATPQIVWATPADISYGTALSNVQLNATTVGNVGGTTSYSPTAGTVLPAGTAEPLTVTFTATDPNYDPAPVTATVYINVGKTTPVINWSPATTLTYGTALGSGTFTATATKSGTTSPALSGTIAYTYGGATIDASTVLPAGDDDLVATYTPSSPDDANYTGATKTVTVHVGKATPVIDWIADNSSIAAKSTVPTATVEGGVQGTFTYSPSGTLHYTGASQTLTVTFTPSSPDDANYGIASKTVQVTVTQLTPALSWTPPVTTFTYGTPLAATEFNATIVTPSLTGPFTYVEHTGDILSKGTHTLTAHFAPDDADYAAADVTAQVTVTAATPQIVWATPADISYGTALSNVQLNATTVGNVGGTTSYSPTAGTVLPAGTAEPLMVTFTATDPNYDATPVTATVYINVGQTTPVINWNPLSMTVGTALGADQLNASTTTTTGHFDYTPTSGTIINTTGSLTLTAVFTPTDAVNYKSVTVIKQINVTPASVAAITPQINWSTPSPINYGTVLGSTQLNATATLPNSSTTVAGSFTYSPNASNGALPAGTYTITANFTPSDLTHYNPVSKQVTITVNPLTPVITWAQPADIVVGTALTTSLQLNAQTTVNGTFVYTPAAGTVMNTVGNNQPLSVIFHPTDTHNYADNITASTTINVYAVDITKTTPVINWATPADINYGTVLSNAIQLNATTADASIHGTFVYSPLAGGTPLSVGSHTLSVTFTPTDQVHYNIATKSVNINVKAVTPVITWANPAAITYGTALSATQLKATANVAGTFDYSPDFGEVLNVGDNQTLLVTFTPADNNYPVTGKTVTISVNKANPVITWANPASIAQGVALSNTQLNATANVPGTFVYTPAIGAVLDAGSDQSLTVTFTPTDANNYNSVSKTVQINVGKLTPVLTWTNPTSITYGTALGDQQLYASTTIPGTFTYSPAAGTVLHAGTNQTLSVTFTPTDAVNYNTVTKNVAITVNRVAVNVSTTDVSRPYNQPNPDFVINYSGFVNGDTQANLTTPATAVTTATTASLVGTYPITVSGAVSSDYTFRYVNATLTITTIGRNLTFNQLPVKTYGDPDFDAGATATSGEPIIYTSSNTAVATIVNGQIHIVGAGYVTITASLPVNPDYNTTPSISQFMLVNKAAQTIDFANIPVQLRGTTYDLSNIKSSSGLPVTFTTNDPMIASINGLTVSSLRVGITGIVANQAGDANYYPANTVVRNLEVKDVTREVIVHPAVSPNGDGINDILYIEGINEHPANRVTIINRNGVRIYEINGYDNATKAFDGHSNFTGAKQQAGTYFYLVEYMVDGVGRHLTGYFVLKYD